MTNFIKQIDVDKYYKVSVIITKIVVVFHLMLYLMMAFISNDNLSLKFSSLFGICLAVAGMGVFYHNLFINKKYISLVFFAFVNLMALMFDVIYILKFALGAF